MKVKEKKLSREVVSTRRNETIKLASRVGALLQKGDILCLKGDLGSGKTTFVQGLAQGLRISSRAVNSPTFVLMNVYEGKWPLYHFDLYRLEDPREIARLDYEEYFYGDGIAVVEWAERLGELTPQEYLKIEFFHQGQNKRLIRFVPAGSRYAELVEKIKI